MRKSTRAFCSLLLITALGWPLLAADKPTEAAHQYEFADEQEFLSQAGPEWTAVGPSRWQRQEADGSILRLGFGLAALQQDLDQVRSQREEISARLADLKASGSRYFELRRTLLTLEAEIDFLERQLTTETATATSSGNVCSGGYSLTAEADAGGSWGLGSAQSKFTAPGPFSPYTKEIFASVIVNSNRGSNSDWDSTTFVGGCCYQVNASASVLGGTWCSVASRAYFQVSNGCTAYRSLWRAAACEGIGGGPDF
ncbi:MAG: hypothetical protein AAF604_01640 [Acidobacteriota bacterium]